MPDLAHPSLSSHPLTRCSDLKLMSPSPLESNMVKTLDDIADLCDVTYQCPSFLKYPDRTAVSRKGPSNCKTLKEYLEDWMARKVESGVPESKCFLPFLVAAKKMDKCLICHRFVLPGDELHCQVRGCQGAYHLICVKTTLGLSSLKNFRCPQHACFLCKQRPNWKCVRCTISSHDKCAPWPEKVIHLNNQQAVCWRHHTDWQLDTECAVSAADMEEIFNLLPLPVSQEEFKLDITLKNMADSKLEPPPYVHIRRNIYLVKKKRDDICDGVGCTSCNSLCSDFCVCRVQYISCSKACRCPETCNNRPFRKEKKIKIVKTEQCGWGVEAAEFINKGEFIVEYIGEVIDDALCEKRLWDMKYGGMKNFYMCEIRKDFTIDATFKGNSSRFLNHSCNPNCVLEKWQVEGETRVGVFAAQSVKVGEPLTYDYRFIQFGPEVECHCGAPNCQGYLGTKKKINIINLCWGSKRKRTTAARAPVLTV